MAIVINQYPLFGSSTSSTNGASPIGQPIIFSVINSNTVGSYFNVKYVAEVYVSEFSIVTSLNSQKIGTFKTTPNAVGSGIFDFRPVLENFLKPDNLASLRSSTKYKGQPITDNMIPMHLIDKFSMSDNSIKYFACKFSSEGSTTATGTPVLSMNDQKSSVQFTIFNGVVQYDNVLTLSNNSYGLDLQKAGILTVNATGDNRFLSNAPVIQYAGLTDYGTVAFLNFMLDQTEQVDYIEFKYYTSAGTVLDSESINANYSNGGTSLLLTSNSQLLYAGVYPANLRNYSTKFRALVTNKTIDGGYYTFQAFTFSSNTSKLYTVNINCPSQQGHQPIRLTWLNQWGAWDYYTFTQKSVKSISTTRIPYNTTEGTWNELTLGLNDFKGGKRNFKVNTSERIKMNTPYVTEEEGAWFEELIDSTEVYVINGYDQEETNAGAPYNRITNKYIHPVIIKNSTYTKKTRANDKLMQYTFEVEMSKTRRNQSV